jgi:hypothetical protein
VSGIPGIVAGVPRGGPHQAIPAKDTYVSERTGEQATLTDESCYPVTARCKICEGPIRLARLTQMEWAHAPAVTAAASSAS